MRAQRHEIFERVVAQLAPLDLVVDLQVLKRSALLASPFIPLQHCCSMSVITITFSSHWDTGQTFIAPMT
jgi:hypothetical protein